MSDGRLPAHLEVAAIRRLAESQGGFATILAKGDREGGTVAIVIIGRGEPAWLCERRPKLDGNRIFELSFMQDAENKGDFLGRIEKMRSIDPDLWLIEVDVADRERFIAQLPQ